MDFIEYTNSWVKSEVTQGRIMIGIGLLLLFVAYSIFRSQNDLLKGALIPLSLLLLVLIGYGGYILTSRPAHAKESIALYESAKSEAIEKEKEKHINDNKAGKTLMKFVYPGLMLLSVIALFFVSAPYYKGMSLGFILLFVSTYIMDNGFVSRSDSFLSFLDSLP
ncbi:MAG: hypothetical protein AAFR87_30165 [Bacteroidota bacterium]